MKSKSKETEFVVVGAGIAGLRAAIELAPAGRVLLLAKQEFNESNTQYAQGGIAAALSDEDEVGLHLQDTLVAGDGLCNEAAARVLVEEGPQRIEELIAWGTQFDRSGTKLSFTREGAHSRSRILHAQGDSTGREIGRALYLKAKSQPNITIREFEFATSLWVEDGRIAGLCIIDEHDHHQQAVAARGVLLATGGLGQVYRETTNPRVATGDGVAMAYRAGAEISDMEFVQFHPTALYLKDAPRFLLSEALRGEGAYLRNMETDRFMHKYHPAAELAPRDVVARAIVHELEVSNGAEPVVYLDLTHLGAARVRERFPRIYATCMQHNIDIATDLIPVRPAAHYAMGGVRTDLEGRTNVPGLYAAGEVTATGVHGANRLASNSLLEGLVYGARAGRTMREEAGPSSVRTSIQPPAEDAHSTPGPPVEVLANNIRDLMWRDFGIVRTRSGMKQGIAELEKLQSCLPHVKNRSTGEACNLHQTALLIARSALARQESRGAHYRMDYPEHDDARFKKHSVILGDKIRFE
jgi:L-aspartate oxidase